MADYTQAELDSLNAAIASGELSVEYQDRTVKYRSLSEMLEIRNLMRNELGLNTATITRQFASTSKGL